MQYYERKGPLFPAGFNKTPIALISLEGGIHVGESANFWENGSTSIGSDTVVRAIREIIQDKKIKAVVLRINSGGGSYVASDNILNALNEAKKAGKKIIVNFSGISASGGYFISQHADKIVCQPTTITGSIGVLIGKVERVFIKKNKLMFFFFSLLVLYQRNDGKTWHYV